jgi:hypothetical protein
MRADIPDTNGKVDMELQTPTNRARNKTVSRPTSCASQNKVESLEIVEGTQNRGPKSNEDVERQGTTITNCAIGEADMPYIVDRSCI